MTGKEIAVLTAAFAQHGNRHLHRRDVAGVGPWDQFNGGGEIRTPLPRSSSRRPKVPEVLGRQGFSAHFGPLGGRYESGPFWPLPAPRGAQKVHSQDAAPGRVLRDGEAITLQIRERTKRALRILDFYVG